MTGLTCRRIWWAEHILNCKSVERSYMKTDIGEYIVGAYLKVIQGCDFIDYNVRPTGGGLNGLHEMDVLGLDFGNKTAYICEVTTHIRGLLYVDNKTTISRIRAKHERQKCYAEEYLSSFHKKRFMFWSPVVPKGYLTKELEKIRGLELIINKGYTGCVKELTEKAKELTHDAGNPFFRMLQIIGHLK